MNEHSAPKTAITVTVDEAQTRFTELVKLAAEGTDIHITENGKPLAKLGPGNADPVKRRIGAFAHVPFFMADDFDELGPEWDPYIK